MVSSYKTSRTPGTKSQFLTPRVSTYSQLNDDLAGSVLRSRFGVGATKNATTTDDRAGLVAVGLAKSQTGGLGGSGTNYKFLLSGNIGIG